MVSSDLQETINFLNAWRLRLFHWSVWLKVILGREEHEAVSLFIDFLEPVAFFCMLQPSAIQDRFVHVATHAIHQANLATDRAYRDELDQDCLKPGKHLWRRESMAQLKRIGKRWRNFVGFDDALKAMNSASYRTATRNFRDLSNHALPPRFQWGITNPVTRSRVPRITMTENEDGTYSAIEDPISLVTSYGLGGTPPLDLAEMLEVNQREQELATSTFDAYCVLLQEMLDAMKVPEESLQG
jgi:hypothetical protein